ncbi:formate/nitrite transporter family protein [Mangrovicella endophytica]|uniref:formate/nitrite transporter family protein n=1 Tax=Mangrovicella endophytica TaxID=2066697 RepID=UPI000C9E5996|nr:formate/nitrite transporter family protein [Mangrovicella endophytica]
MGAGQQTDRATDLEEEEAQEDRERLESDPQENLENAPESGETLTDFFSFEEIFARVLATASHELSVTNRYLFWSGLGAGGALGLTFLARVVFTEAAHEPEPGLLGNLLYPIGFLIIVIGRYQLFTENTLTPVVLVLTKLASVRSLLRLWLVVFAANMVGALAVAGFLAVFDVLDEPLMAKALEMARHSHGESWFSLFSKALFAGWIVAAMVWLVHAGRDTVSKALFVFLLMYFIGVGGLFHVITSSVEVFFLAFRTEVALLPLFPNFVLPILLGNTVGGITFVAVLNYVQFSEHRDSKLFQSYGKELSWREWLFGGNKTFADRQKGAD